MVYVIHFYKPKKGLSSPVLQSSIYLLKVNNRNTTRTRFKICLKLTIKAPEKTHWRRSGVFIVKSERMSYLVVSVSIVNFERVNAGWIVTQRFD